MTVGRPAKGILISIAALLLLGLLIAGSIVVVDALPGSMVYIPELDPDVRVVRAHVNKLKDIERIDVLLNEREWIRTDISDTGARNIEPTVVITDPKEIQQVVDGFREARRFAPYWTLCGFYIRLDFHSSDGQIQTLLAGVDDCKSFTAPGVQAVGTMANDYFYDHYVQTLLQTLRDDYFSGGDSQ